jgi:RNA polymerase sigma-70 factor (ECF subfamily)
MGISAILEVGFNQELYRQLESRDSEEVLIHQAATGDQAAFTALYEMHAERVYRHVRFQVLDGHDAEDITQEVFVKAWKSLPRYRQTGAPFVSWLIVIARNAIVDHFRSKKNVRELDESNEPHSQSDPVSSVEAEFGRAEIREALMGLNGDKRTVLIMHFIDGFSYEEIGKALGKSEGAIRVIQHRALKDMKKILSEAGN